MSTFFQALPTQFPDEPQITVLFCLPWLVLPGR